MGIIGSIRKHSWVAVLIVGVAIVAFILGDLTKNNRSIPDMGEVNGEVMTRQRFDELMARAEEDYKVRQQVAQVPSEVQSQIREMVWEQFVQETLFNEQAEELGLKVTPAELGDMYTGKFIHPYVRQSFTNPQTGVYDTLSVRRTLENLNSSSDTTLRMQWVEMEKAVKQSRIQQKYAGILFAGFYMPKTLAAKVAEYGAELSNVRIAALPFQSVSDDEVTLADADYQKYYKEHQENFRVYDEFRTMEFITFPINPTPQDLADIEAGVQKTWAEFQTIEDAELPFFVNSESYRSYDSTYVKANTFKAPLDAQIEAAAPGTMIEPFVVGNEWMMAKVLSTAMRPDSLRANVIYVLNEKVGATITTRSDAAAKTLADSVSALLNGNKMTFEQALEQFSDDPQKNENKGDLNWVLDGGYSFFNEQVVNTPVGQSFVVADPRGIGYMVVKVADKTPANKKYRVALITRPIVPSQATTDAVYTEAHKFASQNRDIKSFEASAQQQNLQMRSDRVYMMKETLAGIENARDIVRWAYNKDTKVGMVTDQVYECDNVYVVAALKDIIKPNYATLEQMRSTLEPVVRREKKAELLMARAEEAAKVGKDINSIATKLNVTVDTLDSVAFFNGYLGRFGMEPKVQSIIAATKSGLTSPIKGASAIYMVQVDGKCPAENLNPEMVRAQMEQAFRSKVTPTQYDSTPAYMRVLRQKSKIVDTRNEHF